MTPGSPYRRAKNGPLLRICRMEKRVLAPLPVAMGYRISEEFSCPTAHKNCGILIGRSGFSGHVYAGRLCELAGRFCRKGLPSALLWARPKEAGRQKPPRRRPAVMDTGPYGLPMGANFIKLFAAPGGGQIVLRLFLPLPAGRTPLILLPLCGIL